MSRHASDSSPPPFVFCATQSLFDESTLSCNAAKGEERSDE